MKSASNFLNFIVLFILLSGYLHATEISTALSYIPQDFDVISYEASLDMMLVPYSYVEGQCLITGIWNNKNENSVFYFHLYELDIESVIYESSKIYVQKEFITAPDDYYYKVKRIGSSDTFRIRVYYKGYMGPEKGSFQWGGVSSIKDYLFAMGVGFNNSYVSATRHWLPCYDHPSDKAKFKIKIKVPPEYLAVSNGKMESQYLGIDYCSYEYKLDEECSTYLMTFAVSKGEFYKLTL